MQVGYGAVGEVPFMLHESGTSIQNGYGGVNLDHVILRYYGPLLELEEIKTWVWNPETEEWEEVGSGHYLPPISIWKRPNGTQYNEGYDVNVSFLFDYKRVKAPPGVPGLRTGLKIFREDGNGNPFSNIFEEGYTYRIHQANLKCDTTGTPLVSDFPGGYFEFSIVE